MVELIQSETFRKWLTDLRDMRARVRVQARLDRLALGNSGDTQPVGEGISELRIHYGPGYRVYFKRVGSLVILLLCGGDKRTQNADIKRAKQIAAQWT